MESIAEAPRRFAIIRNRSLMTLMLGHFTVDTYVGLLPMLYPLLITQYGLDFKTVGLISLAYSGTASLAQPFFGWLADRHGTRLIGIALIWTACFFAAISIAPSFAAIVLFAGIAGLGSGAYHPFGALNASAVIEKSQRNTAMSVYIIGGTLGVALAPLIGAAIFPILGIRGTALTLIPGVVIALWLLSEMRTRAGIYHKAAIKFQASRTPIPIVPLLATIGIMMSRSWTMTSVASFTPTWYASMGYPESFYGALTTVLQLSSALGTLGTGTLADRYGRRGVIIATLVLTIPALLLFAQFTGPIAFVTATLIGFSAASTGPLMLIIAQQLMAGRAGMASGLILGLGFVTGAIGTPVTGAIIDAVGFQTTFQLQTLLVAATIGLAWFLPTEARLQALSQQAAVPEPSAD